MSNSITYTCHCKVCNKDFECYDSSRDVCWGCSFSNAYKIWMNEEEKKKEAEKDRQAQLEFDCRFNPNIDYLIKNSICRVYITE